MPDPKLKTAMHEIRDILVKHDIAGCINLQSQTHSEWLNHFSPSWSCVTFNRETGELKIRCKRKDFESHEAQKQAIEQTASMIFGFYHVTTTFRENMMGVIQMLGRHVDINNICISERPE